MGKVLIQEAERNYMLIQPLSGKLVFRLIAKWHVLLHNYRSKLMTPVIQLKGTFVFVAHIQLYKSYNLKLLLG